MVALLEDRIGSLADHTGEGDGTGEPPGGFWTPALVAEGERWILSALEELRAGPLARGFPEFGDSRRLFRRPTLQRETMEKCR